MFVIHDLPPTPPPIDVVSSVGMAPTWMSTTVESRDGEICVMGGSAADGEPTQWCLVEARDLDEAIRLAGEWPDGVRVEIRPVDVGWAR